MRKVMLLAAMLAMVLAAAAPAFSQTAFTATATAVAGGPTAVAGSVQYVDCDQIAAVVQYADADADDFSAIAQELGVTQAQLLACLGDININTATAGAAKKTAYPKTVYPHGKKTVYPKKTVYATTTAKHGSGSDGGSASLPPTGGPGIPSSALALGAGALLVGGGLLARRIVR